MRREYVGGAQAASLTSPLGNTTLDTTIYCDDLANWPTGVDDRPFYVVIDRNTISEEKILCASRSGNAISVYDDGITNGRGADGTAITSHSNSATIEHVFTATDADEANSVVVLIQSGSDGNVLVGDTTQPNNAKWSDINATLDIIDPFLLMGA